MPKFNVSFELDIDGEVSPDTIKERLTEALDDIIIWNEDEDNLDFSVSNILVAEPVEEE